MASPLCPYFGECGGCSLQNIEYQYQLKDKNRALQKAIDFYETEIFSDKEYKYRNRMDFIFHKNGLGLREKGNWKKIVDVEECKISDEGINRLLKEVRDFFKEIDYFDLNKQAGTFKYCVIRTAKTSSISFVLNEESSRLGESGDKIREFAEKTTADNVTITYVPAKSDISISSEFFAVKGGEELYEEYLGKKFWYSVQGFFQNNHAMAEKMQSYVHELLIKYDTKNAHLLDLYGGVGTFGIINSDMFKDVLTIESVNECVDSANKNIIENNINNAKAIVLDAKNLRKVPLQSPLYVITDPPRTGMDDRTITHLNVLKPNVIVYISCNIDQLQKDIPKFKEYSIKSTALFDLFPQTPHSEAVVELIRR